MKFIQQNFIQPEPNIIYLPTQNSPSRKFQIIKQLGQGGQGKIYQAKPFDWDNQTQDIAIKLQLESSLNERQFLDNIIAYQNKEGTLTFEEKSQIVKIYDITNYQEYMVTIMEIGEIDLYNYLQSKKGLLSINEKIKILRELCQSIWFLHHNNLIHRDLKPENFLKVKDEFKLIDFGLVKTSHQKFKTEFVGSSLFQAPEIKQGSNDYTSAVDIWSLGGTFFEILTESTFNPSNLILQEGQIKTTFNQPVPKQIEIMLINMLKNMLQIDSNQRITVFQVIQELRDIDSQLLQLPKFSPFNFPQKQFTQSQKSCFPQQFQKFSPQIQQVIPQQNYTPIRPNDLEKQISNIVFQQFQEQQRLFSIEIQSLKDWIENKISNQQNQNLQLFEKQNQNISHIINNLSEIENQLKQMQLTNENVLQKFRSTPNDQSQIIQHPVNKSIENKNEKAVPHVSKEELNAMHEQLLLQIQNVVIQQVAKLQSKQNKKSPFFKTKLKEMVLQLQKGQYKLDFHPQLQQGSTLNQRDDYKLGQIKNQHNQIVNQNSLNQQHSHQTSLSRNDQGQLIGQLLRSNSCPNKNKSRQQTQKHLATQNLIGDNMEINDLSFENEQ